MTHLGHETFQQYGVIHILSAHVHTALARSSAKKGVLVYFLGRDNDHDLMRLPKHNSEDDAATLAERIGDLARGVVPTLQGWAVRVNKLDVPNARSIIDPDFAREVGHDLMHTDPRQTTHHYVLKNVPFDLTLKQSVPLLKQSMGYTIRPLRSLKARDRTSHNVHFIALGPPPRTIFQIDGYLQPTTIVPYVQNCRNTVNKWAKALEQHDPHCVSPDYQVVSMNVDSAYSVVHQTAIARPVEILSNTSDPGMAVFPDNQASATDDVPDALQAVPSSKPLAPRPSTTSTPDTSGSFRQAMDRLHEMEQHMHDTFHNVHRQFKEMQHQHDNDLAALTDSFIQMGHRVDSLASDVTSQIQHLTSMVQALMTQNGTPLPASQPVFQPTPPPTESTGFIFGARQLRRNGSGSRSPRRDADEEDHVYNNTHPVSDDGIPQLPADFSFG